MPLNLEFRSSLLNWGFDTLGKANYVLAYYEQQISDIAARGGLYSSQMETAKAKKASVETDIANLTDLIEAIRTAKTDARLYELEEALMSCEYVYS